MGMHEDECECELCCKDAYLTMKTPAERIRAYLEKPLSAETSLELVAKHIEYANTLTRIVEHLLEGCEKYAPYYKGHYAEQAIEAAASEIK